MKRLVLSIFVVACLVAAAFFASGELSSRATRAYTQHENWIEFVEYMREFGKVYENEQELMMRFGIYLAAKATIDHHNSLKKNWTMGINQFADLTNKEYREMFTSPMPMKDNQVVECEDLELTEPASIDWQEKGYVTPVKDQGVCISGWAFAATGGLEGGYKAKSGKLVSFSEQQLMACSHGFLNGNCNKNGLPLQAYSYVRDYGIMKESDYPYENAPGDCKEDASKMVFKIKGYREIYGCETILRMNLAHAGVVTVVLDASSWQHYKGGIIHKDECGTGQNHAVLAVGYGEENGMMFWRLKNSFGTGFGEKGYIRLEKTNSASIGTCAVAKTAVIPIL